MAVLCENIVLASTHDGGHAKAPWYLTPTSKPLFRVETGNKFNTLVVIRNNQRSRQQDVSELETSD